VDTNRPHFILAAEPPVEQAPMTGRIPFTGNTKFYAFSIGGK
jgi:hypothetical protein